MPVKRSRVGRSSSFGDAGFLSQVPTPEHRWDKRSATPSNSAKILKPSDVAGDQQARPTILTVASPEMDRGRVDVSSEKPIGAFLEKCYYCNSKIRENVEVFMYGYLHAFCTSDCRDRQIIFDKELEKASAKPIEAMNEHRRVSRMKNQFGFQLEKKAAP
ncbi:hypothetical protein VitviT2T_009291 [Vitis vinifera]|uniref:FLZ-type domain-containing protein n=1 Tax=Vitis vinifera TaxID=29760 RepID=A0ABY9C509_VITVI|nr:uncharacterized protein LOC100853829 isoform X2 [Vitis vinifera]XP_034672347.1 uncharacterized protein LOC117903943 isoform X2 [Vitis riparia]WJZ90122.1 hypothetical protein VitviT2T_009291 [Vitis vinifera]|eukprot:XP_003632340.1 PREDICTED: uncharacterized protein LOC100853829 isoform X2 [Vitis vinifera]